MKLTSYVSMEIKKNGRVFVFAMPFGAPFADCSAVAHEVLLGIGEMAKKAQEELDRSQAQELPAPDAESIPEEPVVPEESEPQAAPEESKE